MKNINLCSLLFLFLLSLPSMAAKKIEPKKLAKSDIKYVILFSWDGAGSAYVKPWLSDLPHLNKLISHGLYSYTSQSEKPTITLPNHTSMVTGLTPEQHQVMWNKWEPQRGLIAKPTIFDLLEKNGLKSGMFVGKDKLKHLRQPSVTEFDLESDFDDITNAVKKHLKNKKLSFYFVHCRNPDDAGHDNGWGSPEQKKALQECDKGLGQIVATLKKLKILAKTAIILTADHGGKDKGHSEDFDVIKNIPFMLAMPSNDESIELKAQTSNAMLSSLVAQLLRLSVPPEWAWLPLPSELTARF